MKKRILYPLIIVIEFVLLIIIANIFGFETENSIYALIAINTIFYTIVGFLIKILYDYKRKNPKEKAFEQLVDFFDVSKFKFPILLSLYFLIITIIIATIAVSIVAILDGTITYVAVGGEISIGINISQLRRSMGW